MPTKSISIYRLLEYKKSRIKHVILSNLIFRSARRSFLTAHSHTMIILQPVFFSFLKFCRSRSLFVVNFCFHQAERVTGIPENSQPCRCQKQPLKKIAVLYFLRVKSGLPGRFLECRLYRKPNANNRFLIAISSFVFLLLT